MPIPDTESNKALVRAFFALMNSGDPVKMARAVDLLADDATYWIPGDWPNAGTFDKAALAKMVEVATDIFSGPLEIDIHGVTAEGERVAVEMESHGTFKDGRPYNNTYHWLFVVRDGRIRNIKEYTDTAYANRAYYGPF
ncbi:MAG TPA: nuclear transport factor 2 family protein [Alphaproteobacteria bacterium]|jgi:ketosteroid isomerase-like protein|nr:nuclear transport factor 2 family protein [Alphaproteobacteria bacterium]